MLIHKDRGICIICIYIKNSINLVSQVTLRSSGTDILYGCHLLRSLYIYIFSLIFRHIYMFNFQTYIYIYISNSNTVWFNFQTYIIFSINLVSFKVTLRSSGTDILYGCHLLLDVCIIYFISCDCIMNNSSLSYPIY